MSKEDVIDTMRSNYNVKDNFFNEKIEIDQNGTYFITIKSKDEIHQEKIIVL